MLIKKLEKFSKDIREEAALARIGKAAVNAIKSTIKLDILKNSSISKQIFNKDVENKMGLEIV